MNQATRNFRNHCGMTMATMFLYKPQALTNGMLQVLYLIIITVIQLVYHVEYFLSEQRCNIFLIQSFTFHSLHIRGFKSDCFYFQSPCQSFHNSLDLSFQSVRLEEVMTFSYNNDYQRTNNFDNDSMHLLKKCSRKRVTYYHYYIIFLCGRLCNHETSLIWGTLLRIAERPSICVLNVQLGTR